MTERSEALTTFLSNLGIEMPLGGDPLRGMLQAFLQALIEADAARMIGAGRYERTEERQALRNGRRSIAPQQTRVGAIELTVPKLRKGTYYPEFLSPRRPWEQAVVLTIQSAYLQGVSTRKMDELVKALGLDGIDKNTVSRMCQQLDALVTPFRERPLEGEYPYVFLDAIYLKVRHGSRVVNRAMVVAVGIRETGAREVLGFQMVHSEEEPFWSEFLHGLVRRGLKGVQLVISDAHEGLKRAIQKVMLGASWQRCRVHFMRNLLARVPQDSKAGVAAFVRTIFAQPNRAAASAQMQETLQILRRHSPEAAVLLEKSEEDILAYMTFPQDHWTRIYSTNVVERLNREIRRRSDVVQVFPDDDSVYRLLGVLLMETSNEWIIEERSYISRSSMQRLLKPEMTTSTPAPVLAPVR